MKMFIATFIPINRPGSGDLSFEMPFEADTIETARKQADSMTDTHPWRLIKVTAPKEDAE